MVGRLCNRHRVPRQRRETLRGVVAFRHRAGTVATDAPEPHGPTRLGDLRRQRREAARSIVGHHQFRRSTMSIRGSGSRGPWVVAAALLLGGVGGAASADQAGTSGSGTTRSGQAAAASVGTVTPQQFATQAAEGGLAEVQLSELARKQASSAEVRKFAERMIADHGKSNTQLQAIAKQKGMTLPKELNAEHKATMKSLQSKKGAEFDAAYMAAMKKDHVKTIALFEAATGPTFNDAELKAFATQSLPVLQEHHQMVESTQGQSSQASR
jgi:putative membrane protein